MIRPVDVHTHLSSEEFDTDRSEVMDRALQTCEFLVDIGSGTSHEAFLKSRILAEKYPSVYFTAGIHPHDADTLHARTDLLKQIEELYSHPKCVGVGECGLDYYYQNSGPQNQHQVFQWHIDQAMKHGLPLMIHTRDAEEDTMKLLSDYKGPAIFHCFTGTQRLADFGIQKGFFISFSGIVTFKSAEDLRKVFLSLPLEQVVIETDSPFLAPIPMRGKRNESAFVQHTAGFLAKLRGIPTADFISQTTANAKRVFKRISG